jgi:DNA-binding MarR family transcriptional regulator
MKTPDDTLSLQDPLENFLGYQLRRAAFATQSSLLDRFAVLGVSSTEAIIIRFVRANPGCTQAAIGRAIGVKRTNLGPIANDLMARGLLKRAPADGRSQSLFLTVEGQALQRKIDKVARKHEECFFSDVPDELRQVLMQVFRSLRAKAARLDDAGHVLKNTIGNELAALAQMKGR